MYPAFEVFGFPSFGNNSTDSLMLYPNWPQSHVPDFLFLYSHTLWANNASLTGASILGSYVDFSKEAIPGGRLGGSLG